MKLLGTIIEGEDIVNKNYVDNELADKQDTLVSGTNIKTINNTSLLGSGNIDIQGGGGSGTLLVKYGETTYDALKEAYETGMSIMADDDMGFSKHAATIYYAPINPPEIDGYEVIYLDGGGYKHTWKCVQTNGVVDWSEAKSERYVNLAETGKLTDLTTTTKTNLVSAINEVNAKSGGIDFEVGVEKPYGTYTEAGVTYQVYSKVLKIDALPATAGITNYPHGITGIKQILCAYGFGTNGFVLNAPRQNAQDNIAIYQVQKASGGSVAIEVGKDRSNMGAYVCLVYAKNN